MIELSRKKLYNKNGLHIADEIISVDEKIFTPDFIDELKTDLEDVWGYKKHTQKLKEHGINI